MLIILGLILISLIVIVGGDRGVVSLIAGSICYGWSGNHDILHYIILSKWNECKDLERIYFCGYYNAGFIFCHLCCNMEY